MNTLTRRSFITTLLAAPAAALALSKVAAKPAPESPNVVLASSPLPPLEWRVTGLAIKVPSNRFPFPAYVIPDPNGRIVEHHTYVGDWDGTFKLEAGCSNPAYILADLYERTGAAPDWAVADRRARIACSTHLMVMDGIYQLLKLPLNWQMLYDWGQHCDELDALWTELDGDITRTGHWGTPRPRFTVNAFCSTHEEMVQLRERLRMHCLSWQAEDPRYRTSYPGIPYPEGGI